MIEAELAENRGFGDNVYITHQCQSCYERRLRTISAHMSGAEQLLSSLDRAPASNRDSVLGDTVVRCAIQHALRRVLTGQPYGFSVGECEDIFRAASSHLDEQYVGSPLESGMISAEYLGSEPSRGWIWSEEHDNDLFGRSFRALIDVNYGTPLCTPSAEEVAILKKGAQLLEELTPLLYRSALRHARVIAVFPGCGKWRGKASSSQYRLSGTIFLNREALRNPWWVAEHILHESLHQKLYDFRHGHSLLAIDSLSEPDLTGEIPLICSLWNIPDSEKSHYWDTHRSLAAFHVYVHLALLCTIAEERAEELEVGYGPIRAFLAMTESGKAIDRAHYLGEKLKESCWSALGLAGQRMVTWLISILDSLAPFPAPYGPYTHLLLDRYDKETLKVETLINSLKMAEATRESEPSKTATLIRELNALARAEADLTRDILRSVNAECNLSVFDPMMEQYQGAGQTLQFSNIRKLISRSLTDVSDHTSSDISSHIINKTAVYHERVAVMVEQSSATLVQLLNS